MKDLNYVTGELAKGRNLQVNLPAYANSMMSLYNGLAYIKLSMNYYTFFEMANDSEFGKAEMSELKGLLDRFNDVAESQIAAAQYSDDIYKHNIDELEGIRASVVRIMEVVTAYVDRLRIYEYVLNRIEYRFKDEEFDDAYYNNGLTNDLMHYILSDKDSVAVNNRISEVVEQLPMRCPRISSMSISGIHSRFIRMHRLERWMILHIRSEQQECLRNRKDLKTCSLR